MVRVKKEETINYQFTQKFGKPIEEFDTIKNAVETLNNSTKNSYYLQLPRFFLFLNQNPDEVIASRKQHIKNDDETQDYYERKVRAYKKQIEETRTGRTTASIIGRIQGFFANNSSRYRLDLGTMKYNKARKVEKYSPDNSICRELYSFADNCRDKLIVALAYQCGLAPIDIINIDCHKIPSEPYKYFEGSRSKTGEIWHGVSTPEIVQEYSAYKKIRGEPKNGEPFFMGREGTLDSAGISQIISTIIKKAGYEDIAGFKPTALRDAFEDALMDAELPSKIKEAMMGHSGGIEAQYGGHKQFVRRMEEAMQKAYKFLVLTETVVENNKTSQKMAELGDAVVDGQKRILALETANKVLLEKVSSVDNLIMCLISTRERELEDFKYALNYNINRVKNTDDPIALQVCRLSNTDFEARINSIEKEIENYKKLLQKSS